LGAFFRKGNAIICTNFKKSKMKESIALIITACMLFNDNAVELAANTRNSGKDLDILTRGGSYERLHAEGKFENDPTGINNDEKATTVNLKVVPNVMQYDKKTFTVKAGQKITLVFENPDFMQHNVVFIKPGSSDKVGQAANMLAGDPNGIKKNYVPDLKEVLFASKLLNPKEKVTLEFTAPAQPGDYPYMCTFPGHWAIMNGVMKVVK
jgi:azurin